MKTKPVSYGESVLLRLILIGSYSALIASNFILWEATDKLTTVMGACISIVFTVAFLFSLFCRYENLDEDQNNAP